MKNQIRPKRILIILLCAAIIGSTTENVRLVSRAAEPVADEIQVPEEIPDETGDTTGTEYTGEDPVPGSDGGTTPDTGDGANPGGNNTPSGDSVPEAMPEPIPENNGVTTPDGNDPVPETVPGPVPENSGVTTPDADTGNTEQTTDSDSIPDESDPVIRVTDEITEQGDEIALPDADTLYEQYFDRTMYPAVRVSPKKAARVGGLDNHQRQIYQTLKEFVTAVADGTRANTEFPVSLSYSFSAADLGVATIVANGSFTEDARLAIRTILREQHISPAMRALMADCPYELYWFDKTHGWSYPYGISYSNGIATVSITTISMSVSADYSANGQAGTYEANTALTGATLTAANRARGIVDYASVNYHTDYDILQYYFKKICELTDYNEDAAYGPVETPYGDPWQLVWVFDDNPDTLVVCEGYSKAFKYLCDLTAFYDSDTEAYLVTGDMSRYLNGLGPHMWNVVRMDDGAYYLVDVTNCDQYIVTYDLFLKGYQTRTTGADGYPAYGYRRGSTTLYYMFDGDTAALFSGAELSLSADSYEPGIVVTFDACGGNTDVSMKRSMPGDAYGELPETERAGYRFLGWYTAAEGGTRVMPETIVTPAADHTLYAQWEQIIYHTVYFNLGGGRFTGRTTNSEQVAEGDRVAKPEEPVRAKYTFLGWFTAPAGDASAAEYRFEEEPAGVTQNMTLYAHWTPLATVSAPEIRLFSDAEGDPDNVVINHSVEMNGTDVTQSGTAQGVRTGARIRLSSMTPDAQIYYKLYPTVEAAYADTSKFNAFLDPLPAEGNVITDCIRYEGEIVLTPEITFEQAGETYRTVTLWAIAVKPDHTNSSYSATTVIVYDEDHTSDGQKDWGDVPEEDRAGLENPSALPKGIWITGIYDRIYTGTAQTFPALRVYHNKTLLKEKTDYTVSYKNNVRAAETNATNSNGALVAPTVTVTGTGNYSGAYTKTFAIRPLDLVAEQASGNLDAPGITLAYNKKVQKGTTPVRFTSIGRVYTLKNGTDYTIDHKNVTGTDAEGNAIAAADLLKVPGTYTIPIRGDGKNCTGEIAFTQTITRNTFVSKLTIPAIPTQTFRYATDGEGSVFPEGKAFIYAPEGSGAAASFDENRQSRLLRADGTVFVWNITDPNAADPVTGAKPYKLRYDEDYELSYAANNAVGTASVTITGKGNYTGSKTVTFKINGTAALSSALFDGKTSAKYVPANAVYTGRAVEREVVPVYKGEPLVPGRDYTVEHSANTSAGTATVLYRGRGAFTGNVKKTYRITAYDLAKDTGNRITVTYAPSVPYAKNGAKPVPEVSYRYTYTDENNETREVAYFLRQGTDFTVEWKNNTAARDAAAKNPPTVVIKGKGNFAGTREARFTIGKQSIDVCTVTAPDVVYTGKAGQYKSTPVVRDVNGATLKEGTDYDPTKTAYYYADDTELANGTIRAADEVVRTADVVPTGTTIRVAVAGKGQYTGTASGHYRVVQGDLSKASVRIEQQYYTGSAIRLSKRDIVVTLSGRVLADSDYEIVSYKNNIKKGKASVTLRGVGYYGREITATFSIVDRPVSFTIRYDGNRATGGSVNRQQANPGTTVKLTNNAFKRTHYTFTGWNTAPDGSGTAYANGTSFDVDEHAAGTFVTLYAQWEPVLYTITYHLQGGVNHTENAARTSYTTEDPTFAIRAPVQEDWPDGFRFAGWYTDVSYKTTITQVRKGSGGNLHLYARWMPYTYTVTFDGNGATAGTMKTQTYSYGVSATLPSNAFKRTGHVFAGWSSDASSGTGQQALVNTVPEYGNRERVRNLVSPRNNDGGTVTLYAVWRNTFDITYVLNDVGSSPAYFAATENNYRTSYTYGTPAALPAPKRDGYTFAGWYRDATFKTQMKQIEKNTSGDMTLYAKWTPRAYTIVFDGNGKNGGSMANQSVSYEKETPLRKNAFTKTKYRLAGWSLTKPAAESSREERMALVKYTDGATVDWDDFRDTSGNAMPARTTLRLYAVWVETDDSDLYGKNYIVRFHNTPEALPGYATAGTLPSGTMKNQTIRYEKATALAENTFRLFVPKNGRGLVFAGWATSEENARSGSAAFLNKQTIRYPSGFLVQEDGQYYLDLYAVWRPKYTVKFHANPPAGKSAGGRMDNRTLVYGTPAALTKNAFTVKGYVFRGWSTVRTDALENGEDPVAYVTYGNAGRISCLGEGIPFYDADEDALQAANGITLYAVWEQAEYGITYRNITPEMTNNNPSTYTVNDTVLLNDPEDLGYVFLGWYSDAAFKKRVTQIGKGSTGNLTLYARWRANN